MPRIETLKNRNGVMFLPVCQLDRLEPRCLVNKVLLILKLSASLQVLFHSL